MGVLANEGDDQTTTLQRFFHVGLFALILTPLGFSFGLESTYKATTDEKKTTVSNPSSQTVQYPHHVRFYFHCIQSPLLRLFLGPHEFSMAFYFFFC